MKKIRRQIGKVGKFANIELPRRVPDVERYSSQYYISFKSRETKYKELLDALKDDYNCITVLQGMAGTGKTTLAKEVVKELKPSKHFTHLIDMKVSYTNDYRQIRDDIAGLLGLDFIDCSESDRTKKLWCRLTNGDKILLILDDVWGDINFDEIGIPNSDNHKGCKVLVTTRSLRVCNKMVCEKTIQLELLDEEEAWIMFKLHAGLTDTSSKSILNKGREIATECKRLPVAIATVASSLKGRKRREEWDVSLKILRKPVSMGGVGDDLIGVYKCLKFSYDYLEDEKAKGLFLSCSLFPEITIEVLTRLVIGMGLFGEDYNSYNDARSQVVIAKNKLLDSCLLLEINEKFVKINGLINDVAQWITNKEFWRVNLSDKHQKSLFERETNIQCLSCEGKYMDLFFSKFDGSKLESLIAVMDRSEDNLRVEVPDSFFENIVRLRVLYISSKDKRPLSLPHSVQSLTYITSMWVDSVDLGDISVLGKLQSLVTLDLVHCAINELPQEITKLEKLKLLNLEYCVIRTNNPFEVIQRCSSLEELYFINSFNGFSGEITLPMLQRYQICEGLVVFNDSLSKYMAFDVDDDKVYFSNETLKYCMKMSEGLSLVGIKRRWRNLMPEIVPIDGGMNDLVELSLRKFSQLQCLIDTIGSPHVFFSKLVVLELEDMEDLKELFNGPISFDSLNYLEEVSINDCINLRSLFKFKINLCHLKTIRLRNCPMLVSLFQPSTSRSLVLLESLDIFNCEGLENIILDERREEESREEIDDGKKSYGSMFPKLKFLDIDRCPLLEYILPFHSGQDLPVLKYIIINRCEGLKNILVDERREEESREEIDDGDNENKSHGSLLPKLEVLDIQECPQLQYAFPFICTQVHLVLQEIRIRKCAEFKCIFYQERSMFSYHLHIWKRAPHLLPIQTYIMRNIKEINLSHFSKIKSVFILSVTSRMALETLTITNCDELKNLIIDTEDHDNSYFNWGNVFPKLKRINVEDCIQLEYIFTRYNHDHKNQTEIQLHLPALECLYLCNLPSLVAMCPKKYHTTFPPSMLYLSNCSQVDIKSFHGFTIHRISKSRDSIIMKEHGSAPIGIDDLDLEDSQEITQTNNQGSLNDDTLMKVSSEIEQFPTNVDTTVQQSQEYGDGQISIPSLSISTKDPLNNEDVDLGDSQKTTQTNNQESKGYDNENENPSVETTKDFDVGITVQAASSGHEMTSSQMEGSTTSENTAAETMSTISESKNEPTTHLVSPKLKGIKISAEKGSTSTNAMAITSSTHIELVDGDGQKDLMTSFSIATTETNDEVSRNDDAFKKVSSNIEEQFPKDDDILASKSKPSPSIISPIDAEIKVQAALGHELILSQELMDEESMDHQCSMNSHHSVGVIDTTIKPSQGNKEVGDGKIRIPSFSIVNTEPPPTKDVDIGDSQKTIAMKDINKLIEEDPLLALEKLLAGHVSISSIRILLQELKSLMDSSSDLDHLISNQKSKSKLISLFHMLNQHQGLLPSHVKEFIEKVQIFFIDNIIKYTTFQQVLKKHNQLFDSKTDLVNKLWSAYSTQTRIDHEISTANARIDELSLQIDEHTKKLEDIENQREDLKSVVNNCNVQKNKLKAECTEWAQKSKELLSALASSEVNVREAEHARNLAKEGFANLKASFPTF